MELDKKVVEVRRRKFGLRRWAEYHLPEIICAVESPKDTSLCSIEEYDRAVGKRTLGECGFTIAQTGTRHWLREDLRHSVRTIVYLPEKIRRRILLE